ncbi:MAG: maleylpyruvate isomerase N-terminal domain-containing protein, partial [Actinomycetota bacterium]
MVDLDLIAHLDPVALQGGEIERLEGFFAGLDDAGWGRPTRCAGWTVRDVLAHLATAETYHVAGIEGSVAELMAAAAAADVDGLDAYNRWQIDLRAGRTAVEVLEEWRRLSRTMRAGFRRVGATGTVDTMIGPYP